VRRADERIIVDILRLQRAISSQPPFFCWRSWVVAEITSKQRGKKISRIRMIATDLRLSFPLPVMPNKSRKSSVSSSCGTLNSSVHSSILLDDSLRSTHVEDSVPKDEPLVRQLRHSGNNFAADLKDFTPLPKPTKAPAGLEMEDRFASRMNHRMGDHQLSHLRAGRRTQRAIVVVEDDDDDLDKSLDDFWAREKKKSVRSVTGHLQCLVLVEDGKIRSFGGHQFLQVIPSAPEETPSLSTSQPSAPVCFA
jgi:hypothetical protein